ncbi:hypothetical protein ART_2337 [Arthrobacter sp. PAMC 25486]|uniref:hypothetical protein n=1 Tax=Arthrobacter sp. PAMC 25486 TaxID=1494608 RepID=UPI000536233D|nr:hypothetical protein [Arthrobacter sp. PAMC 25486]AIY01936.1 hypothetical protein ART_2337 [Arthrobacter sp. PAMC 25486]
MGVNDTTHARGTPRISVEESCTNLGRLLDALAEAPVLVVGPPAVADDAQNDRIRELTGRYLTSCRDRRTDLHSAPGAKE